MEGTVIRNAQSCTNGPARHPHSIDDHAGPKRWLRAQPHDPESGRGHEPVQPPVATARHEPDALPPRGPAMDVLQVYGTPKRPGRPRAEVVLRVPTHSIVFSRRFISRLTAAVSLYFAKYTSGILT